MTTPSELADLVIATTAGHPPEERPGLMVLRASLADPAIRGAWLDLRAAPPPFVTAISLVEADGDADLERDTVPEAADLYRITVETPRIEGELRLFFPGALTRHADELARVDQVLIAAMAGNETFSTYRNRIQMWSNDPVEAFAASEPLPDPRTNVSDFTGEGHVPADIRPWLQRRQPAHCGKAYAAWSLLASRRLMAAVADRVSKSDGAISYHFSGPPTCAVTLSDDEVVALMPHLQAGAAWVFTETRDADTRHLLLAAEWARSYRKGDMLHLGEGAFESAKSAHAAYVKAGSKEALKALSELRKTVVDEGQKASQRAQDLAGAMWKDIAVAAAPFVLKILPDSTKAGSQLLTGTLAVCAATFLVFSFVIQVFINKRYFRRQREGRQVWKRQVNVALRNKDIEELSEEPLNNSVKDYRVVRLSVGVIYALLVAALLTFAWFNLAAALKPPIAQEPATQEASKAKTPVIKEPEAQASGQANTTSPPPSNNASEPADPDRGAAAGSQAEPAKRAQGGED